MRTLITDYGKYIPYGSSYYESIEFLNYLKNSGEDVDLLKNVLVSPIDGSINENDALIRKYDFIVSYTPFDFDFILRYMKAAKIYPNIIFLDFFNFIDIIENKVGLFSNKRKLLKNFIKILPYIQKYIVFSKTSEHKANRNLYGIDIIYAEPYVKERYFVKSEKIKRETFVFPGRLNSTMYNIDFLLNAVNYIVAKTNFLEFNNMLCILTNSDDIATIRNKINKIGLTEYFLLIPPLKNYPELLGSSGFSVFLPPKKIMISNVLETMAAGLPVLIPNDQSNIEVVSVDGNKKTLIEDTKNGLVYDHTDYRDLAEKIMLMIKTDEASYKDMREYTVSFAKNFSSEYEYKKIYGNMKEIYSAEIKLINNYDFSKI
jgi:hypothetical protein